MRDPAIVLAAFTVQPMRVCGITLHPLTLRAQIALEHSGNSFVTGETPATEAVEISDLVEAVRILSRLESFSESSLVQSLRPDQAHDIAQAVRGIIAFGWSTALPMREPGKGGAGGKAVDRIGLYPRLIVSAMSRLGMTLDMALDAALCQLFVLVAAWSALDGKEPAGRDYFDLNP